MQRELAADDRDIGVGVEAGGGDVNTLVTGFTDRELPMPDEASAIEKLAALVSEGIAWKGPPIEEQREGPRRFVRWADLEICQAGRGILVLVRNAGFDEWWHDGETWAGDPMGLVREWRWAE